MLAGRGEQLWLKPWQPAEPKRGRTILFKILFLSIPIVSCQTWDHKLSAFTIRVWESLASISWCKHKELRSAVNVSECRHNVTGALLSCWIQAGAVSQPERHLKKSEYEVNCFAADRRTAWPRHRIRVCESTDWQTKNRRQERFSFSVSRSRT